MNDSKTQMPNLPPEQVDKVGQWFDVLLYILCFVGLAGWLFVGIREVFTR